MKTGLTLMKIAPLHKGHIFLIERALEIVDELIVVVYDCPDKTSVPLPKRCMWIRELFPSRVTVVEGFDAPNVHEDTEEVKRMQERYVGKVLAGRPISHFFSSENYGEHMSNYLGAENSVIDLNRTTIPVSSTMIRNDFLSHIHQLPELVLKDLLAPCLLIVPPSDFSVSIASEKLQSSNLGMLLPLRYSFDKLVLSQSYFDEEFSKFSLEHDRVVEENVAKMFELSPILSMHVINILLYRRFNPVLTKLLKKELASFEDIVIDQEQFLNSEDNEFSRLFIKTVTEYLVSLGKYYRYVSINKNMI